MTRNEQMQEVPPEHLYHYCVFNEYSKNLFTASEIFFSYPLSFNDPFDCQIRPFDNQEIEDKDLKAYLEKCKGKHNLSRRHIDLMMKSPKRKDVLRNIGLSFAENIGVYCLTERKENILMWSHYANNHKGFCLEFKTDCKFFGRAQKIIYSEDYPNFNFFKSTQKQTAKAMLLTKASDWSYEKEWRIVDHEDGAGLKTYPKNSLTGVILGCRIEEENKKTILEWLSRLGTAVNVHQAKQSKSAFKLDVIES